MARTIITRLIDDLDGSEAAETVTFAIDGTGYEIDLNNQHAAELREFLSRFIDGGTRTGRVGPPPTLSRVTHTAPSQRSSRDENTKIREWAGRQGLGLSDRGRIPREVVERYYAATKNAQRTIDVITGAAAAPKEKAASSKPVPEVNFAPAAAETPRKTTRTRATAS